MLRAPSLPPPTKSPCRTFRLGVQVLNPREGHLSLHGYCASAVRVPTKVGVAVDEAKIDHIHIAVKDLGQAQALFSKLFGTEFKEYGSNQEMGLIAMLDTTGIALTAATAPDSPVARFIDRYGEGVQSVAIKVSDLDKTVAHWQGCGIRVIGRSELKGRRAVQFHPKDTCGVLIELVE